MHHETPAVKPGIRKWLRGVGGRIREAAATKMFFWCDCLKSWRATLYKFLIDY